MSASAANLQDKIIRQVEHYMGDFNLPKDRDGTVFALIPSHHPVSSLSTDPDVVFDALEKSQSGLLELDRNHQRIRRAPSKPAPELTEQRRSAIDDRTIYARGMPRDDNIDDILDFFESRVKNVEHVQLLRRRNRDQAVETTMLGARDRSPGPFVGAVLVTFDSIESATNFLQAPPLYKGKRLTTATKRDHLGSKPEYNDKFDPNTVNRTVWVHGFDNLDISEEALVEFFSEYTGAICLRKRLFRDRRDEPWMFLGSVFVTFETEDDAINFLNIGEWKYGGDRLKAKMQIQFYIEKGMFKRGIAAFKAEAKQANEE